MNYLKVIILGLFLLFNNIYAQSPPSDFKLECTSEALIPWSESETITILENGQVEFVKTLGEDLSGLIDTTFTIPSQNVQTIWQAVQNNNFFSLNSEFKDDSISDGSILLFTIIANGDTNQVYTKNISQQEIENILVSVNSNVPAEFNIHYTTPKKFNVVPIDPCAGSSNTSTDIIKELIKDETSNKIKSNYSYNPDKPNVTQIPHGGFEVGYEMSIFDAIASGRASIKSKGVYYGDGVSITGDNTNSTPPSNKIKFKLNLEFYGPCDNSVYESNIVNDIINKWNGQMTSDGKTIEMEIVTLSHPGDTIPTGTPGFDNINLECGEGRSFVNHLGSANTNSVSNATWYPEDKENDVGLYAHEAGHLMGLEDQYDDWVKLPGGKWFNTDEGGKLLNDEEMTNLLQERAPDLSPERIKYDLTRKGLSIPRKDHENDLMARTKKPVLQDDIDALAAKAGLIITFKVGDILTCSNDFYQNLIVGHSSDFIILPGQKKTLWGIYTACIDKHKIQPDSAMVFNAAPSLEKWNGVPETEYLLKLIKYIDSTLKYCGNSTQYFAQEAIWRITDNATINAHYELAYDFLKDAGLDISDQIFHFPKLISNILKDTISRANVPFELFVPDIQPKSINAEIGQNVTFNASISKPDGFEYSTDVSWLLEPPEGSSTLISSDGSFTPDKKGVYEVTPKLNITDLSNNITEYTPLINAFAIVPDEFTETFEHGNLNWFHWETFGDSKWEITNEDAQSGSFSVKSGKILENQSTSLAIDVNLPKDTSITFAMKFYRGSASTFEFDVDSGGYDYWFGSDDWKFFHYRLDAGEHKLTWTLTNKYDNPSTVWLDNIFFPANSVVTNINSDEQAPLTFTLFQNYPNPFNPTTKIKYSIPAPPNLPKGEVFVQLKVYDVLGREVATLVNKQQQPGNYEVEFDASNLSSGVYFYRLTAGSFVETKKMILLK